MKEVSSSVLVCLGFITSAACRPRRMPPAEQTHRRPRRNHQVLSALVLIAFAVTTGGCVTLARGDQAPEFDKWQQKPPPKVPPVHESEAAEMSCEAYCSSERMGQPGLRLSFADNKFDFEGLRLDWTVYKEGFEAGAYQRFHPLRPGIRSTVAGGKGAYQAYATNDGLELIAVDRSELGTVLLAIEGLEPGLLYRWRLQVRGGIHWRTGMVAVCDAPVCPIDYVNSPNEPGRIPQ